MNGDGGSDAMKTRSINKTAQQDKSRKTFDRKMIVNAQSMSKQSGQMKSNHIYFLRSPSTYTLITFSHFVSRGSSRRASFHR